MSHPRTPIADLRLQGGGSNLRRALKRQAAEEAAPEFSEQQLNEVHAVDELIQQAIQECRRGSMIGPKHKKNPSFANLALLVKTRTLLLQGHTPGKRAIADILADADAFLKKAGVN